MKEIKGSSTSAAKADAERARDILLSLRISFANEASIVRKK